MHSEERYDQWGKVGHGDACDDAGQCAYRGLHDRLDKELEHDIFAFCPQCPANADLASSLGHGGQHDVHDADAADDQGNESDEHEQHRVALLGFLRRIEDVERHGHQPVFLHVPFFEQVTHHGTDGADLIDVRDGQ